MRNQHARRGTLLVVVLGLITIFLALMLAITVRVYNSTKGGTALQQNVQAYITMQAAKIAIDGSRRSLGGVNITFPVTAGDQTDLATAQNRPFGDMLGWCHLFVDPAAPDDYFVVATGGSSASGAVKNTINAGDPMRNAYDVRYYYKLTYNGTAATPRFAVALQPVKANSTYKW